MLERDNPGGRGHFAVFERVNRLSNVVAAAQADLHKKFLGGLVRLESKMNGIGHDDGVFLRWIRTIGIRERRCSHRTKRKPVGSFDIMIIDDPLVIAVTRRVSSRLPDPKPITSAVTISIHRLASQITAVSGGMDV